MLSRREHETGRWGGVGGDRDTPQTEGTADTGGQRAGERQDRARKTAARADVRHQLLAALSLKELPGPSKPGCLGNVTFAKPRLCTDGVPDRPSISPGCPSDALGASSALLLRRSQLPVHLCHHLLQARPLRPDGQPPGHHRPPRTSSVPTNSSCPENPRRRRTDRETVHRWAGFGTEVREVERYSKARLCYLSPRERLLSIPSAWPRGPPARTHLPV